MVGNYYIIKLGSTAIAGLKTVKIQTSAKTEELSNAGIAQSQNMWERIIATKLKWSVSTDQLVLTDAAVKSSLLRAGRSYTLYVYKSASDSTAAASGSVICTKASITASVGSLIKGSFTFEGNGPLT